MVPAAPDPRPPVVVVTGPTAAGKTSLALEIAERCDGEIVNADSMQVYRFLDIGTAKPTPEQQARAPHHLLDVVTPAERYSAGRYLREAREAASKIHARGRIVVLAGGTGLYIRAFLEGLAPGGPGDRWLREKLEREHAAAVAQGDPGRLHARLAALDPAAAERIHPNDLRRIVRALEIREAAGAPASRVRESHAFGDRPYRVLHLALDPGVAELDARIERRCRAMLDAGLLREVRGLLARGYDFSLRPLQALGYRHLQPVTEGSDTLENALAAMLRDTRQFARRQRTWLRKVPAAVWLDPRDRAGIRERVDAFLAQSPPAQLT